MENSFSMCIILVRGYMIQLFSKEDFNKAKTKELLNLQCEFCGNPFKATKNAIQMSLKGDKFRKAKFCSIKCSNNNKITKQEVKCKNCNKIFFKTVNQLKKCPNSYCSRSCAVYYNNTHKIRGYRRSKFEIYLEQILPPKYPNLKFHFNRKDAINSELDIYIPAISLAFELNGVFHYEPIYGEDKLKQIQNNDNRKFQACLERNIELCIIDVSSMKYFKPDKCEKYLNIIESIIEKKWRDMTELN